MLSSTLQTEIQIPNWKARKYQVPLWRYLDKGGKRAVAVWHRRAGKDDLALHWTAKCVLTAPGNYWHMLPEAAQARKAIWDAVNPHTGRRRIDEAFPEAMRARTLNNEMKIEFVTGSIWQVIGSDNYNSLVGSTPRGVVFSEWALAKPQAWAYLRPILAENNGWALFIYTSRGRNHGYTIYDAAKDDPSWFAERLTAKDTNVFTPETLEAERQEYIRENGPEDGDALFRQEYMCDFDAPLVGTFYAKMIAAIEENGQIRDVPYDRNLPVYTAWDIGRTDDTAVWFYQVVGRCIYVIDYFAAPGGDVPTFVGILQDKKYLYGKYWLPHDGKQKTFAAPRSVYDQLSTLVGIKNVDIVPDHHRIDGIAAVRAILPRCWFDAKRCKQGLEALRQYQREWDDERKVFSPEPLHNWASHAADAFRYLAVAYKDETPEPLSVFRAPTLNEAWRGMAQHEEARI